MSSVRRVTKIKVILMLPLCCVVAETMVEDCDRSSVARRLSLCLTNLCLSVRVTFDFSVKYPVASVLYFEEARSYRSWSF
jgi:hypothetical protein